LAAARRFLLVAAVLSFEYPVTLPLELILWVLIIPRVVIAPLIFSGTIDLGLLLLESVSIILKILPLN
jgi:hypothetical protein